MTGVQTCALPISILLGHYLGRPELLAQPGPGLRAGVSALVAAGVDGEL